MITLNTTKIFSFILCLSSTNLFSQFNPGTNTFSSKDDPALTFSREPNTHHNLSQQGGFPCSPNTFWATSAGVDEYTLVGNTVTFNTTVCPPYLYSIAYCNNLNGGVFSPTFYDANDSIAAFYDGAGWTTIPLLGPGRLFNCGGNGNYLYYSVAPAASFVKSIARYDGASFTTIYTLADTNKYVSVADLNVDDNGNVWFFIGTPTSPFNTDSLYVVSPAGQLIKQYAFSYNTLNAYGSFMLNGIIYIGLGSANLFHPNTLIPVTVTSTTATAGTPIPMPSTINYGDLASCNAGDPLSVKKNVTDNDFSLFPNPVTDELIITSSWQTENEYKIINVNGYLLQTISAGNKTVKADIHSLSAGIYIIEMQNSKGILRKKFVKL